MRSLGRFETGGDQAVEGSVPEGRSAPFVSLRWLQRLGQLSLEQRLESSEAMVSW